MDSVCLMKAIILYYGAGAEYLSTKYVS